MSPSHTPQSAVPAKQERRARSGPGKVQRTHRRAKPAGRAGAVITPEERSKRIALAAYFRAESRGFAPGGELQDWLEAETELEASLRGKSAVAGSV